MLIQIHVNLKLIKKILGGHGQKWVWPVWSQDSQSGCITRMNWLYEMILCMLVQIQESKMLIQWFLGGCGHLVHETQNLWYFQNEFLNWADFLHGKCDTMVFA